MKKAARLVLTVISLVTLVATVSASHARGMKGVVRFHGHYTPCQVVKVLMAQKVPVQACEKSGPGKDVIVVVGAPVHLEKGTTIILKFKGQEGRTKVMGKIRCTGDGLALPALVKECATKDEYVIWTDEGRGSYVVIEIERGIFDQVHLKDAVTLKAKVKRAVVEGC